MKKDNLVKKPSLYNRKYFFVQDDSNEHENCTHTTGPNFTRSFYVSVDKTDQNCSQQEVVLSVWDLNVCHSSVQWRIAMLKKLYQTS